MNKHKLKPCPFCGNRGAHEKNCYINLYFESEVLDADIPWEVMVNAWNQRVERTCIVEWKHIGGDVAAGYCECGTELDRCHDYEPAHLPNFCPECGARIESD